MSNYTVRVMLLLIAAQRAAADVPPAKPPTAELDSVLVTATRTKRGVLDVPGTTSVIQSETMERNLVRTIKDLVRYEPGVFVQNDPQRFGLAGFNIRGIGGNRIQMLVDGVRIPDAYSIGTFQSARRNMVDVDALKAVEIIRGAGSALYGSDALGGVVSFVSKDPRDYLDLFGKSHYESLKLQYASANDLFLQTATLAGAAAGFEGLLLLTHGQGRETENKGTDNSRGRSRTAPNPQDTRNLNLLSKLLYRFSDDNVLRLTGEAMEDEIHTDVLHLYGLNFAGRDVYRFLTHDRQSRWRVSLDQNFGNIGWGWLDHANWRIYGQQTRTRQGVDEARTTLLGDNQQVRRQFSFDQSIVGGELQGNTSFSLGPTEHRMVFGAEAFHTIIEQLRDGSLRDLSTGSLSNAVTPDQFPVRDFPLSETVRAGVYWQDELSFWDKRIELLPALRFDYFSISPEVDAIDAKDNKGNPPIAQAFTEFTPKFGALLHISDALTLHGQYAEGFRAPNFADANSGFVNFTFGYASIPNPNLEPETSTGGEVGLRLRGDLGYADANFYRNDYKGFIQGFTVCDPSRVSFCPPFGLLTFQTLNTPGDVRIQGFEFKGEVYAGKVWSALEGLTLIGSYAYSEGWNRSTGQPISSVNPMRGVIGLRYDAPGGGWGTETILTLAAPKRAKDIDFATAGDVFTTPGFGLLDLTGYYRYGEHATLTAGIFNVLDKRYFEWEDVRSRGNDPHAGLGGVVDIRDRYSRPGINVAVSLKVEF